MEFICILWGFTSTVITPTVEWPWNLTIGACVDKSNVYESDWQLTQSDICVYSLFVRMGDFMLASAGNDIRFWDVNGSYSLVKQFNPHSRNVCDLAWSLDNSVSFCKIWTTQSIATFTLGMVSSWYWWHLDYRKISKVFTLSRCDPDLCKLK